MSTWYDMKTNKPVLNKETIARISGAIEITGLVGLDRLFSFMIVTNLKKIAGEYIINIPEWPVQFFNFSQNHNLILIIFLLQ